MDPTGHRTTTLEIPLDKKREVRGLQRTHRIAEAPAPAPSNEPPSLGFDIDESREVARVDPGSWAEELGVAHGWVLKSVDKNRIADHQSFVDAALTIAKVWPVRKSNLRRAPSTRHLNPTLYCFPHR